MLTDSQLQLVQCLHPRRTIHQLQLQELLLPADQRDHLHGISAGLQVHLLAPSRRLHQPDGRAGTVHRGAERLHQRG